MEIAALRHLSSDISYFSKRSVQWLRKSLPTISTLPRVEKTVTSASLLFPPWSLTGGITQINPQDSADLCQSATDVLRVYVAKSRGTDGLGLAAGRDGIKDVVSGRLPSSQRSGQAAQFLINTALNLATKALDVYQKVEIFANCPKAFSFAYPRRNLVGFQADKLNLLDSGRSSISLIACSNLKSSIGVAMAFNVVGWQALALSWFS